MTLPNDLTRLLDAVYRAVPRLLSLMDRDPDSPMRGCLHPAYWRDKSSDVADMRRQEAALTFAWLWRHDLPGNPWHQDRELLLAALRALGFWTRSQNKDGTFDEWYQGEHGYAATAFGSHAVALTVEALGEALDGPLRTSVLSALEKSADWLTTHDDFFKTNHQAVGVGALAALGNVLGERRYHTVALRNAQRIVERTHAEGWSKEITGADLGYTFLLVEYLTLHAVLTGETSLLDHLVKTYAFAAGFLHPDLSSGAEYGICANPYFSRVATVALAPHSPCARAVLQWMTRDDLAPCHPETLQDDLRIARYAFQPLLAALLHEGRFPRKDLQQPPPTTTSTPPTASPLILESHGDRYYPEAGLLAIAREGYVAWAAPCQGGFLRVAFRDGDGFLPMRAHRGYAFTKNGTPHRNARYRRDVAASFEDSTLTLEAPLAPVGFVMPPYLARVGLRFATSLPMGPRWSRWAIDQWRARKGTALNQSSAGIGGGKSACQLKRHLRFNDQSIEILDTLSGVPNGVDGPYAVLDGGTLAGLAPDADRRIPLPSTLRESDGTWTIRTTYDKNGPRLD